MKKIAFLSLLVFLFTGCDGFLDSENLVKKDTSSRADALKIILL